MRTAARCSQRFSPSVPRQRHQSDQSPRPSMANPMATMMRKDQKTIATGGCSSFGTVSRPASGALRSCFKMRLDSFGISMA
ncbi:hypothetical protein D9M69_717190 [compost metagenome]